MYDFRRLFLTLPGLNPIIVKKRSPQNFGIKTKRPLESSTESTRTGYSVSSNFPVDSSGLGRAEKATLNFRDDQSFLKTSEQINRFWGKPKTKQPSKANKTFATFLTFWETFGGWCPSLIIQQYSLLTVVMARDFLSYHMIAT